MELPRQRLDSLAFALGIAALFAACWAFASTSNGPAMIMCGISLAGLIAGRLAGISGGVILVAALGLVAILWVVWVDPLSTPRRTSAFAHSAGGLLAGWGIATTLLRRGVPAWAPIALVGVIALTIGWELAEYAGDRLLDTALVPNKLDSSWDIFFGCAGGVAGMVVARLLAPRALRSSE